MFADFEDRRVDVGSAELAVRVGGEGPPLLLAHGYPQTHVCWHEIAPALAEDYRVIAPDLRGYGESTGPADPETADYSNRELAEDLVALAQSMGHDTFRMVGHDRGARVGYRLALDHPDRLHKLAVLDIIPTLETVERMDYEYAKAMYHWLFLAQPHPVPERLIGGAPTFYLDSLLERWAADADAFDPAAVDAYHRAFERPSVIRASCEDYRAGMSVDLAHDRASRSAGGTVQCPTLALWGAGSGTVSFDPLAVWQEWAEDVTGRGLDCGHFLMEEAPDATLAELRGFL